MEKYTSMVWPLANRFVDNAIDMPWRNFPSPEFQRKVPLFMEFIISMKHSAYMEGSSRANDQLDSFNFSIELRHVTSGRHGHMAIAIGHTALA